MVFNQGGCRVKGPWPILLSGAKLPGEKQTIIIPLSHDQSREAHDSMQVPQVTIPSLGGELEKDPCFNSQIK